MSEHKLEVQGLSKVYKNGADKLEVLRGINLGIKDNEFVAIQGPSGAGKSTLLHILGGLDRPTSGGVLFEGVNLYGLSDDNRSLFRNQKIGFVFQFYHLLTELNALENVLLPALIRSWRQKKKALERARGLLESLGLGGRLSHRPNQLSGGEQQRVAIARALINDPHLLLCDEPTGNLDSENGGKILKLFKEMHKSAQTTIILVTHDKDIAGIAQRVIYLKDGILAN
jgi:ABC-type lipoprotein export system ATPase subunit